MLSKGFPGNEARNEASTRQRNTATITKYTLPVTNVLLEYFAATFPMLTPTEMTMVVTWCRGQGLDLRCWSTRCTEPGNSLFHHVDESGELGRFSLGNGSHCWCRGVCVVESEGEGCGTMQYKPRGVMDLLQGIWIIREMVGELELESVGDLGPKLLWEAMGEGLALFCSRDMIFVIRKVVIAINSLWYFPKSASNEIPTLEASPTSLSISPIYQHLSVSDPGYNLYTASTNC